MYFKIKLSTLILILQALTLGPWISQFWYAYHNYATSVLYEILNGTEENIPKFEKEKIALKSCLHVTPHLLTS